MYVVSFCFHEEPSCALDKFINKRKTPFYIGSSKIMWWIRARERQREKMLSFLSFLSLSNLKWVSLEKVLVSFLQHRSVRLKMRMVRLREQKIWKKQSLCSWGFYGDTKLQAQIFFNELYDRTTTSFIPTQAWVLSALLANPVSCRNWTHNP